MVRSAILSSKPCQNCTLNKITLFTMGNMYISFSKMPIFIYLEKIANIRKYRKNDEYFPHHGE